MFLKAYQRPKHSAMFSNKERKVFLEATVDCRDVGINIRNATLSYTKNFHLHLYNLPRQHLAECCVVLQKTLK